MKKEFRSRIENEGIIDTRKYRYIAKTTWIGLEIWRIRLDLLDTTAAIDNWEKC